MRKGRKVLLGLYEFVVWSKIEQTGVITRLTIIDKLVKVGERAVLSTGAHKMRPTTVINWLRTRMAYVENIYALIFSWRSKSFLYALEALSNRFSHLSCEFDQVAKSIEWLVYVNTGGNFNTLNLLCFTAFNHALCFLFYYVARQSVLTLNFIMLNAMSLKFEHKWEWMIY